MSSHSKMEDIRGTVKKCVIIVRVDTRKVEKKEIWGLTVAKCGCSTIRHRGVMVFLGASISKSIKGISKLK